MDPDVLTAIAAACRVTGAAAVLVRCRMTGRDSDREAEPYQLVNWGRRWYLVAFDVGRADWRTFRRGPGDTVGRPGGGRFTPRPLPVGRSSPTG